MTREILSVVTPLLMASLVLAGPVIREESQRQTQVLEGLTKSLAEEPKAAAKFALLGKVMKEERAVELRRRILEIAIGIPGPEREAFLTTVLAGDADAGVRSQAATALGHVGSEQCLTVLATSAGSDRTTSLQIGDICGLTTARRAATFAIAELAARHPKLAENAAAKLRALPAVPEGPDSDRLADARIQAIYQITRDEALLKLFHERVKSADSKMREDGVIAFRFLKLKEAPADVSGALKDASPGVRSWAALVLGEIGDPKSAEPLMAAAGDTKEDRGVRCNAIGSLGRMKAAAAADLMEKLLTDADPSVPANAAVALYRITGKKVPQFPEGYRLD